MGFSEEATAEFDSRETIDALTSTLQSLGFEDALPYNIGAIITTPDEVARAPPILVVASEDPEAAINQAKVMMQGRSFKVLVVGIDPGRTTGIAVVVAGQYAARRLGIRTRPTGVRPAQ